MKSVWGVGVVDPFGAEVLAIHKACSLILSCLDLEERNIVIFSDSELVVKRIYEEGVGSVNHVNILYDIREFLRQRGSLSIKYTPRAWNSSADCLAKSGSAQQCDRLEWSLS